MLYFFLFACRRPAAGKTAGLRTTATNAYYKKEVAAREVPKVPDAFPIQSIISLSDKNLESLQ